MKIRSLIIFFLVLISTSCSILKKNIVKEKDKEDKKLKYIYLFDEANKNRLNGNFQTAIEQYSAAFQINPKSAVSLFYTASIFAENKDYSTAIVFASKAVNLQPNNYLYNIQKADLLSISGNQKEALSIYESLLKTHPKEEILYHKSADIYSNKHDRKNLISIYERKQKNYEYSPETAVKLFNLYINLKDYKSAEKTVSELCTKYPEEIRFQGMAAEYYYHVNQILKAEKIYKKLLSENPNNSNVNLSYALFCKKINKKDDYYNTTKKLLNSDLQFIKKTSLLQSGQYRNFPDNEYFELLKILYKKHPNKILSNTYFAEYYIDKNDKEKAIPYIRKSLKLKPSDFNMAIMLFSLTYDVKDFQNLSKDTEKYISYFPNRPQIYLYKGISEYKLKRFIKAEKSLINGKSLIIDDIELEDQFNFYLFLLYKNEKKYENAKIYAKQILSHKTNTIKINELYGDLLFLNGKKEKALIFWKKAKENGNNSKSLNKKINNFNKLTNDDII